MLCMHAREYYRLELLSLRRFHNSALAGDASLGKQLVCGSTSASGVPRSLLENERSACDSLDGLIGLKSPHETPIEVTSDRDRPHIGDLPDDDAAPLLLPLPLLFAAPLLNFSLNFSLPESARLVSRYGTSLPACSSLPDRERISCRACASFSFITRSQSPSASPPPCQLTGL
eukprot:384814-Prorocentrum_minimum.AAC.4